MSQADTTIDFYHINRRVPWASFEMLKPGDVFDVGGNTNPYFKFFEEHKRIHPVTLPDNTIQELSPISFLRNIASGAITANNLPVDALQLGEHLVSFLREIIWEDVRQKEFPHLPSRQRCIWLIPSLGGVQYWLTRMGVNSDFQVLRVKVQGRVHTTSETHLLGDCKPLNEIIQMARQYWLGVVENTETQEIIFEGRVSVVEIVSPQEYSQREKTTTGGP